MTEQQSKVVSNVSLKKKSFNPKFETAIERALLIILRFRSNNRAFPFTWWRAGNSPGIGRPVLASDWLHEFINLCKMFANFA